MVLTNLFLFFAVVTTVPSICLAWSCSVNHVGRRSCATRTRLFMSFSTSRPDPPPMENAKRLTFRWKDVAKRAAASCTVAFQNGIRRVSVDIPQISSVDRSTIARKFEDDHNFLLQMIANMGSGRNPTPIGKEIKIMMGGFEKGGDYLSDEGLYGYQWREGNYDIVAIGNAEIDSSALKELPKLDDGTCRVILFNIGLDRLSFVDKFGLPPLDDVETAYVLRRAGPGLLSRQYPQDYSLWRFNGRKGGQPSLVDCQSTQYKAQQAEATIRNGATTS